jgi:DNA-binding SARP family transcriptional activator
VLGRSEGVVTEADRYRLAPGLSIELDADRFETHARRALRDGPADVETHRSLRALYRGELFEGEPDARWQEEHRDRLRRFHVDLTLRLAERLAAAGDWTAAADLYHEITIAEDLNEEAHRGLMAALAASGSRARAIRHYEKVVEIVREALDSEPEEETRELAERLKG